MFPLYDSSPRRTFPYVNYSIIAFTIFIFCIQVLSDDFGAFVNAFGFIPIKFNLLNPSSYIFIITSIFMHGGIFHILSNLWFLHIFGDNVEDSMGHFGFLLFYLAAGIVATLTQYFMIPGSMIPVIGASGAISGVAGAYFILYRRSTIKALVPVGIFLTTANLPVWFFLGYWFLLQLFSGFTSFVPGEGGGVAWYAHIGGFMFGLFISIFLKRKTDAVMI